MRVAIAQIRTLPTRLDSNVRAITAAIDRAAAHGAEVVIFPELTIPGYGCLDHFEDPRFIDRNLAARDRVIAHSREVDCAIIVGFVDREGTRAYNSAAVIDRGELLAVVDKTLLPNYDIFWESKYFESARRCEPVDLRGRRCGVQICEDLWDDDYPIDVTSRLVEAGANWLVNISASPFSIGKLGRRRHLVEEVVREHSLPFTYVNLVGAQDGYEGETIFDGRSFALDRTGRLQVLASGFAEDLHLFDLEQASEPPLEWPPGESAAALHDALVLGIGDYFMRNRFSRAYVGLSGGIDSAVTVALAVAALGRENVVGVTMPSHVTSDETRDDAVQLAEQLGIRCEIRPIGPLFETWRSESLAVRGGIENGLTPQNVQARLRGLILMEYSNEDSGAIVISTGNKTELALGYCTLYGDMCGGLAAISDVSKHRVYELAEHINVRAGSDVIPRTTIDRAPTAELEPDQTDAANLPADYDVLSPLVEAIVEGRRSRADLCEEYPADIVDHTLRLVFRSEYKRRQAAPGIRVSTKAFGAGRRYPIDGEVPS